MAQRCENVSQHASPWVDYGKAPIVMCPPVSVIEAKIDYAHEVCQEF